MVGGTLAKAVYCSLHDSRPDRRANYLGTIQYLVSWITSQLKYSGLLPSNERLTYTYLQMMDIISRMWAYMRWQMTWWLHRVTGRLADLSSIYQPLQHDEIRLITLAPGKWRDPIECNLQIASLDSNPTYEALSYVWGDASLRRWIHLKKSNFDVSKSLEVALRHLRHEDSERVMWIDAICINQSDNAEKSEQVKRMQFIYARTSHLVVWVGEASEDSDLGMRTLEQIGEELKEVPIWEIDLANVSLIRNMPEAIESFDPKPWVALNRLFQRPWFQRVWVLYSPFGN